MLSMKVDVSNLAAFASRLQAAKKNIDPQLAKMVQEIGPEATGHMKRVLAPQTGLKLRTINAALKGRARGQTYEIYSKGGDIRLKFFNARETARGVTAAPWSQRRLYPATFIRSGWWPKRGKPVSGGNVVRRVGKAKFPIEQVRSGLFIPTEMVTGKSAVVFYGTVNARLGPAVEKILLGAL
jgi:hypothetical protein